MSLSSPAPEIEHSKATAVPPAGKPYRSSFAGIFLFIFTLAALAAGGWGLLAAVGAQGPPVGVGDSLEIPGGSLRVDEVTPESMAPMQTKKYQRSGMSMSSNVPDMTPEGYKRFNVDVSLAAETAGIDYSAKDFQLTGEGIDRVTPLRNELDPGLLPQGSAIQGILVFQVPEDAKNLMLTFGDSRQPVALDVPEGKGHSNHSSGGGEKEDDGHAHEH
ncbi:MAG: hypothetical protein WA982_11055 [Rubrobacteraceae bacterium]